MQVINKNAGRFKLICLVILCLYSPISFAQRKADRADFILADGQILANYKISYQQKDKNAVDKVAAIITDADKVLGKGNYSVTYNKARLAPSNDPHDYVSQAPYWWRDPAKPDGKPYIRKDGERNPEIYLLHDDSQMGQMVSDVKALAMAYYFTGDDKYTQKAQSLLKVWFINAETRMNPNLNYAQGIPGITEGRGIGIIETVALTAIPDMLNLMKDSKNIDSKLLNGIKKWYKHYADWLLKSKNGKDERSQINNHGTNYDLQLADFALFTGNKSLAIKVINEFTIPRIDQQFTVDGAQPLELIRTRSWSYANMNLYAWCRLAIIADHLGIDLWNKQTIDGKGIERAVVWCLPYALKQKEWRYDQIVAFDYDNFSRTLYLAGKKYPQINVKPFFEKHPMMDMLQYIN